MGAYILKLVPQWERILLWEWNAVLFLLSMATFPLVCLLALGHRSFLLKREYLCISGPGALRMLYVAPSTLPAPFLSQWRQQVADYLLSASLVFYTRHFSPVFTALPSDFKVYL